VLIPADIQGGEYINTSRSFQPCNLMLEGENKVWEKEVIKYEEKDEMKKKERNDAATSKGNK
jgi:hypothetical protein